MTKKDTENKEAIKTEEKVSEVTETPATETEATEAETKNGKGFYLRAGALVMFVGVAALVIGSVWSTSSTDIMAAIESAEEEVTGDREMQAVNALTFEESTANASSFKPSETFASNTTAASATPKVAPAVNSHEFAMQNQQTFQNMRNQQRETVANNLQKQREMMRAQFEKADKQRQQMMEFARNSQQQQPAAFQQPAFKQDPMREVMETHRVEMMKLMEERRQQFITEMNQARTTRS